MQGGSGRLLRRANEISYALDAGFNITLNDVTCEEFQAMQIVKSELHRWSDQKSKRG